MIAKGVLFFIVVVAAATATIVLSVVLPNLFVYMLVKGATPNDTVQPETLHNYNHGSDFE